MTDTRQLLINGTSIRARRKALGIGPTALAAEVGITEGYLRDLEMGRQENTTVRVVGGLMLALNCQFNDITRWGVPGGKDTQLLQRRGRKADRDSARESG